MNEINDDDHLELEIYIFEMIDEYLDDNILLMSKPFFHKNITYDITQLIYEEWDDAGFISDYDEDNQLDFFRNEVPEKVQPNIKDGKMLITNEEYNFLFNLVHTIVNGFFEIFDVPSRSQNTEPVGMTARQSRSVFSENHFIYDKITTQIHRLKNIYQPKQKTKEWYEYRHHLFTASSIWKIFGSDSQYNSIIYEKCKPYTYETKFWNSQGAMQWGIIYEPVSILLYESIYNTKIDDFGCIPHPEYDFIAASPDGINIDPNSNRYGRMIEVKNIFNRDITVIPKEDYWIQMQIQMETCNLNECDFIETRFKEFNNEFEFYEYDTSIGTNLYKGLILCFIQRNVNDGEQNPVYEYMPFSILLDKDSVYEWINNKKKEFKDEYILYNERYWYLDEFSCLLIKRNVKWFKNALPKIKNAWTTVLNEKESGYEHRCPKKKTCTIPSNSNNFLCVIKMDA